MKNEVGEIVGCNVNFPVVGVRVGKQEDCCLDGITDGVSSIGRILAEGIKLGRKDGAIFDGPALVCIDGFTVGCLIGFKVVGRLVGTVVEIAEGFMLIGVIGIVDGAVVGQAVGIAVGTFDGNAVGSKIGSFDAITVGTIVGTEVGLTVGCVVGTMLGSNDGSSDGSGVG